MSNRKSRRKSRRRGSKRRKKYEGYLDYFLYELRVDDLSLPTVTLFTCNGVGHGFRGVMQNGHLSKLLLNRSKLMNVFSELSSSSSELGRL